MSEQAFTLGSRRGYDQALRIKKRTHEKVSKLGVRPDEDPPYEGGWVFKTPEEAHRFLSTPEFEEKFPNRAHQFSVYAITLPDDWAMDVSALPAEDGVHRLQHDSVITHKVQVWLPTCRLQCCYVPCRGLIGKRAAFGTNVEAARQYYEDNEHDMRPQ